MRGRAALALVALGAAAAVTAPAHAELPLGRKAFTERSRTVDVAPGLSWTRIVRSGGPWRVNVLTIDRGALDGHVAARLSNSRVAGRERLGAIARRTRALAGVNGGFFAVDGDPVGALVVRGRLVSEPVGGRSALLVPQAGEPSLVAPLRFAGRASVGGRTRLLDGVDRRPGRIPACGGRGGDRPTQRPNSVLTCTDRSELVLLTRSFGARTPPGGVEAIVRDERVERVRAGGGTRVPRDGYVLWGSGSAARFLREAAAPGSEAAVALDLRTGRRALPPGAFATVTGGGPRLLGDGRLAVASGPEGFAPRGSPSFFEAFVASRNPRTLVGVRGDGTLLLVTVDGRRRGWSAGVTLIEAARVMRHLGAEDALNLDGGGSTAMTVRRRLVNRPSDSGGERRVGDALLVLP
jgi:Phosphodiester glycosidase